MALPFLGVRESEVPLPIRCGYANRDRAAQSVRPRPHHDAFLQALHTASILLASLGISHALQAINFDAGWRFALGDSSYIGPTCDQSGFAINISGTQCYGLSPQGNKYTAEQCQEACCLDSTCLIWQFDSSNPKYACWTGADCPQNVSNPAWTSFKRAAPTPTPPLSTCADASQPCAPGFDDSRWRSVNTPHDFVVESAPDQTADRGHGYLPFNVSWYRKSFPLDAALNGKLLSLAFDGVYKNSDMWLNGVPLGHFTSGYVSFRWYIHNVSGAPLRFDGTPNVLAVRVDALSAQEGWFYEGARIRVFACALDRCIDS